MRKHCLLALLPIAIVLTGCANNVNLLSHKEADYQSRLGRTLLVTSTPDEALDINGPIKLNAHYYARVVDNLKTGLEERGVPTVVLKLDRLALEPKHLVEQAVKNHGATVVLALDLAQRTMRRQGQAYSQSYQLRATLTDLAQQRTVWQTSMNVVQDYNAFTMDSNMQDIAAKVIGALEQEKLL